MINRRLFLALSMAALLSCKRPPVTFRNTDLTGATFGRQLALVDHHGQSRSLTDFQGKATVVFFGYTSCPDICPTMLAKLADVMKALGGDAERVQVLFVTVDPERDSAERLKAFVPWFHPTFLGLRGDAAQTRAATEEFRVFAARKPVEGELGYVIDHSTGAYVFDPAGRLRLYVKDTSSVDDITADIRLLLQGN
ncbi:MAG: SCO family protein [Gammaproteobacteria bacterium]|nr:SCO family protein [Gammaproteobacteria bacterium]MBU1603229.1 SCO family protein [Gammaproteobacteria bacterium]MBU2432749.1 SCO family protein [Gammaproteobacteria bacterium]MBU2451580.1 SCO family protein [Gammaproteobacteria bacterium]